MILVLAGMKQTLVYTTNVLRVVHDFNLLIFLIGIMF
jgi:hypothetical protein